jgi:glutathione-regulated potassium-efflux system ancillary protein KefF
MAVGGITSAEAESVPRPIALIYAHPYPDRSRAGRALLDGVRDMPGLDLRSLYELYPDHAIDVDAEQRAVSSAEIVVWQNPLFWYGMPALLHLWIEKVLAHGWAYGPGGEAVKGKTALWVTTTGAPATAYRPGEMHGHPFDAFVPAVSQTAVFCGMEWRPPFVVHGAHRLSDASLRKSAVAYRDRLEELARVPNEDDADG